MAEFQRARDPTAGVMMREEVSERAGGFSFENTLRNDLMARAAGRGETVQTSAKKTGTTICGVTFKNGVVLGADTRATGGSEICDKNCEKIHYIAPNIFCCGAGTAADTEKTTEMIASQLELARLNAGGVESRTVTACTLLKRMLFRYQGHISAALVLGGVDAMGVHLYDVYPHGSTSKLPYVSMGSGSLAAMSVLEMKYKEDMEEAEAIAVVKDAIMAGIMNDLGSGSNVDVTVIRKDKLPSGEREP
uniref:Proteasome subunit beta n=1 Tax=Phaeomonas parva TaxID=124430 RepID=A0A6U4IAL3_9STRA|mmetsp:Transcript_37388/g.116883  ORF Transcript_37388/g.116883 Transcript_37388/m.116883 type:complete len:248 (+) Transcript_37388:210-953(+)